jgi:hypothetical protein
MCGRFTYRLTWREIVAHYRLTAPATPERNLQARYNICPTTTIDAVIERDAKRELVPMRWGLVPSWWKKKAKETPSTFNARAETVASKPMFRSAFKRTRCLIVNADAKLTPSAWMGPRQGIDFTELTSGTPAPIGSETPRRSTAGILADMGCSFAGLAKARLLIHLIRKGCTPPNFQQA